jgi:hypothetical protein
MGRGVVGRDTGMPAFRGRERTKNDFKLEPRFYTPATAGLSTVLGCADRNVIAASRAASSVGAF